MLWIRSLLTWLATLAIFLLVVLGIVSSRLEQSSPIVATSTQQASAGNIISATTSLPIATSTKKVAPKMPKKPVSKPISATSSEVERIQNPYPFPQESTEQVNVSARDALVNILCMPRSGSFRPISGSGVVIDSRGVILTNAHVAQYVLLSESPQIDLSCTIRTGSPAQARFTAEVLYMPKAWVNVHASEINQSSPLGTGEHDYALLVIVGNVDGTPIQTPLPYLPLDTRQGIGFLDDQVLGAGYPAEFAGGLAAQSGLYPVTSISNIKQLLTFTANSIDLFSVGGVIEAQGGSSGGPVINMWGRLIGIITTTSEGATTAERDLRALSLSYINTDIALQSGKDLQTILDGNVMAAADDFRRNSAPGLISEYLEILPH